MRHDHQRVHVDLTYDKYAVAVEEDETSYDGPCDVEF
jgi:hypothetical protein